MIITHRVYSSYDIPIYITFLSVFVNCLFDDIYSWPERSNFRLFDDDGHLIGRSATYNGVNYAE